jgi:hypothetical protein
VSDFCSRRLYAKSARGQQHVRQTAVGRAAVSGVLQDDLQLPQPLLHSPSGQLQVSGVRAHVRAHGPDEAARALGARARALRHEATCLPLIRLCFRLRRAPPRLRLGLHKAGDRRPRVPPVPQGGHELRQPLPGALPREVRLSVLPQLFFPPLLHEAAHQSQPPGSAAAQTPAPPGIATDLPTNHVLLLTAPQHSSYYYFFPFCQLLTRFSLSSAALYLLCLHSPNFFRFGMLILVIIVPQGIAMKTP